MDNTKITKKDLLKKRKRKNKRVISTKKKSKKSSKSHQKASKESKKKKNISGELFKRQAEYKKVSLFTKGSMKGCFMLIRPEPVPIPEDSKFYKKDKKTGDKIPSLSISMLNEINITTRSFFLDYAGWIQSPVDGALRCVWNVAGRKLSKTVYPWIIQKGFMKNFTVTKDSKGEILKMFDATKIREVLSNNEEISNTINVLSTINRRCMMRSNVKNIFFMKHKRSDDGPLIYIPCIDARCVKEFMSLSVEDIENIIEADVEKNNKKQKSKNNKRVVNDTSDDSTDDDDGSNDDDDLNSDVSKLQTSSLNDSSRTELIVTKNMKRIHQKSKEKTQEEINDLVQSVNRYKPSTLLQIKTQPSLYRYLSEDYLPSIPYNSSSKEDVLNVIDSDWKNTFSILSCGSNVISEDDFRLIVDSRLNVGSLPPYKIRKCSKVINDDDINTVLTKEDMLNDMVLVGTDPNAIEIEDEEENDDDEYILLDNERISIIESTTKAVLIPVNSINTNVDDRVVLSSCKREPIWYKCQSRDIIISTGLPIERILSSPANVNALFNKATKTEDFVDLLASMYVQHKMAAYINKHVTK